MVYLLHFHQPISAHHSCQHYLGYTVDLDARLAEHAAARRARPVVPAPELFLPDLGIWF